MFWRQRRRQQQRAKNRDTALMVANEWIKENAKKGRPISTAAAITAERALVRDLEDRITHALDGKTQRTPR